MPDILDRVAMSPLRFRPRTRQEFFAFQLARKLRDETNLRQYLLLVEQHSHEALLRAYTRVASLNGTDDDASKRFQEELQRLGQRRDYEQQ